MIQQFLLLDLLDSLDSAGRSKYLINKAVSRFWTKVRRAASPGSSYYWDEMKYLEFRFCECLVRARSIAVKEEEYEWAEVMTNWLRELDWTEEEIKKEFLPNAK